MNLNCTGMLSLPERIKLIIQIWFISRVKTNSPPAIISIIRYCLPKPNWCFYIPEKQEPAVNQIPVSVSVSNGDLVYASYPIICGHFRNDSILYAEKSIDANLGEILSARHQLGIYPGDIGTSDVFLNNNTEED